MNFLSTIDQDWRYIHYKDDTEELYDLQKKVNEWYNLAGEDKFTKLKKSLKASSLKKFVEPVNGKQWQLVVDRTSYSWEDK